MNALPLLVLDHMGMNPFVVVEMLRWGRMNDEGDELWGGARWGMGSGLA